MFKSLHRFLKHSLQFLTSHPIWSGWARLLPLLRFLRLQAIYALGENEVWLPWFENLILPLRKGDAGLTGNCYVGLHECRDMPFAVHLLRDGDLFVDIGAISVRAACLLRVLVEPAQLLLSLLLLPVVGQFV